MGRTGERASCAWQMHEREERNLQSSQAASLQGWGSFVQGLFSGHVLHARLDTLTWSMSAPPIVARHLQMLESCGARYGAQDNSSISPSFTLTVVLPRSVLHTYGFGLGTNVETHKLSTTTPLPDLCG